MRHKKNFRIGVIGCGLIGARRAQIAANHTSSQLLMVADISQTVAEKLAAETQSLAVTSNDIISHPGIDIVVIATPNKFVADLACAALRSGKHVLIEKPMGCHVTEARRMCEVSKQTGKYLKVGFNHRYHPAIQEAFQIFNSGKIGEIINLRAQYGHGGRSGYEKEWRGNPELAGGGELTDQGVHIIDLIHWFIGKPTLVYCAKQTAVWPITPLEDNGFGILHFSGGVIASFHTSWTQWKNCFSFEIFGTLGSLSVDGLGGSYGVETLTQYIRHSQDGIPDTQVMQFDQKDLSWHLEWEDFIQAINLHSTCHSMAEESVFVMETLSALYESTQRQQTVFISNG